MNVCKPMLRLFVVGFLICYHKNCFKKSNVVGQLLRVPYGRICLAQTKNLNLIVAIENKKLIPLGMDSKDSKTNHTLFVVGTNSKL